MFRPSCASVAAVRVSLPSRIASVRPLVVLLALLAVVLLRPSHALAQSSPVPPLPAELHPAASSGRETVRPASPRFCGGSFEPVADSRVRESTLRRRLKLDRLARGEEHEFDFVRRFRDLTDVARLACTWPNDPHTQAWTAAYRQVLVNQTGAPPAVLDAILRGALTSTDRTPNLVCPALVPSDSEGIITRTRKRALRSLLRCSLGGRATGSVAEFAYWADRGEDPGSMLDRVALVHVLSVGADREPADVQVARWVMMARDVSQLAFDAYRRDVRGLGLSALTQAFALLRFFEVTSAASRRGSSVAEQSNQTPELARMLSGVVAAAYRDTAADMAAHRVRVQRALTFEAAYFAGEHGTNRQCADALREDFFAYVRSNSPDSVEDLQRIATQPVGYLLGSALYLCEITYGAVQGAVVDELLRGTPPLRGPRTAAAYALRQAVAEARADRAAFPLDPVRLTPFGTSIRTMLTTPVQRQGGLADSSESIRSYEYIGVVDSVRHDGAWTHITFEAHTVQIPIRRCTQTDQVQRIRDNGQLEYRMHCVDTGRTEPAVNQRPPIAIPRHAATGIERGRVVRVFAGGRQGTPAGDAARGFPADVWRSESQRVRLAHLGMSL